MVGPGESDGISAQEWEMSRHGRKAAMKSSCRTDGEKTKGKREKRDSNRTNNCTLTGA